jgi:hypothetical protein
MQTPAAIPQRVAADNLRQTRGHYVTGIRQRKRKRHRRPVRACAPACRKGARGCQTRARYKARASDCERPPGPAEFRGHCARLRAIHHGLHKLPANPEVLCTRIDVDRADASNHGTLIKAIAAHNPAISFRHHAVKIGARKHHRKQADSSLWLGKITRKTVGRVNRGKDVEANPPANGAILRSGNPNHNVRPCFLRHSLDPL